MYYNDAGQLLSESRSGGIWTGVAVTNLFDGYLRRTQMSVKNGSTVLATASYGYDIASRLASVTDGTYSAEYAYLANSALLDHVTLKQNSTVRLTTIQQHDFLNRLTQIGSAPGGSGQSAVSFRYTYNAANQRTRACLADSSFWVYEYDLLGQVISGKRYWSDWTPVAGQQFEYGFDDIGNRTRTKAGGDAMGGSLRSATYTPNLVNQYTSRTVPGGFEVLGIANAAATVTVNNQAAYRKGEYYHLAVTVNNGSGAAFQSATSKAVNGGASTTVTGNVFVPRTPEAFTHDDDGNLTGDGRWTCTWDAENRLASMETLSTLNMLTKKRLVFEYDYLGRRIRKSVYHKQSNKWIFDYERRYVDDGWNLAAELNDSNGLLTSFMWGLDLSGSEQGAGGVGGLLAAKPSGSPAQFVMYDGNGNVVGLVDGSTGTISAQYEYGPFGESVRVSGIMAAANPFRFSTKFTDSETGLVYYGFRYYNPITGRWLSRDPIGERGD